MDSEFKFKFKNPLTGEQDEVKVNLSALLEGPADPDAEVVEGVSPDTVKLGAGIEFPASVLQVGPAMALPVYSMWAMMGGPQKIMMQAHNEYDVIVAEITNADNLEMASSFLMDLDQETIKEFLANPTAFISMLKPSISEDDIFADLGLSEEDEALLRGEVDDAIRETLEDEGLIDSPEGSDDFEDIRIVTGDDSEDAKGEEKKDDLEAPESLEDLAKLLGALEGAQGTGGGSLSDLEEQLNGLLGPMGGSIEIELGDEFGAAAADQNKYLKKAASMKAIYTSLGKDKIAKVNALTVSMMPKGLRDAHDAALRDGDTLETLSHKYHEFFTETPVEEIAEIYEIMETEENSIADDAAMVVAEIAGKATPKALETLTDHFTAAVGHSEIDEFILTAVDTVGNALAAGAKGKFRELGLKEGLKDLGAQLGNVVQAVEDAMDAAGLVPDSDVTALLEKKLYREFDIAEERKAGGQEPSAPSGPQKPQL